MPSGYWAWPAIRVPVFWLGLMGLLVFYAKLDWLPGRVASTCSTRVWSTR